jgi:hypothetical protein
VKRDLKMKIMFEDLTYEAQVRLLDEAGISSPVEMKWHILPIAVVDLKMKLPAIGEDDSNRGVYG